MKKLILILSLILSPYSFAQIEGVYTVIIKKQEEKKKSRWTLADWLITKKTIALQDQWLALHSSSSWFELILDYGVGKLDDGEGNALSKVDLNKWGAALYVKFLGLEYNSNQYSMKYDSSDYRLNLLFLGSSIQSTHIRGFYGKRDYSVESFGSYDQNFWGANLTLYLASFLGVEGQFTKYLNTSSKDLLFKSDGERTELTAFIDLWLLRVYATKFRERMLYQNTTATTKSNLEGTVLGVKLFF